MEKAHASRRRSLFGRCRADIEGRQACIISKLQPHNTKSACLFLPLLGETQSSSPLLTLDAPPRRRIPHDHTITTSSNTTPHKHHHHLLKHHTNTSTTMSVELDPVDLAFRRKSPFASVCDTSRLTDIVTQGHSRTKSRRPCGFTTRIRTPSRSKYVHRTRRRHVLTNIPGQDDGA